MGAIERLPLKERLSIDKDTDNKELHKFRDLLEKCLQLDNDKRLTIEDALRHKFLASARLETFKTVDNKLKNTTSN